MSAFKKVVRLGTREMYGQSGQPIQGSIFCKIEFTDDGKLSISGVEGPTSGGNCLGSCGQIDMSLREPGALDTFQPAEGWSLELVSEFLRVWDRWHLNDLKAYDSEMEAAGWAELARKPMLGFKFTRTAEASDAARKAEAAAVAALKAGETFTPTPEQVAAVSRPYQFTVWIAEGEPEPEAPEHYERARHLYGHGKGNQEAPERKTLGWLRPSDHPDGLLGRKLREDGPGYGSAWFREEVPAEALEFLRNLPDTDRQPAWI